MRDEDTLTWRYFCANSWPLVPPCAVSEMLLWMPCRCSSSLLTCWLKLCHRATTDLLCSEDSCRACDTSRHLYKVPKPLSLNLF